jgi:hypothetical protein
MGTIRVMIFAMLSKISFLGMTDDWSPEEMKLAGIKGKMEGKIPAERPADKKETIIEKDKYIPARLIFEKLLLEKTASLPYTNILNNIQMR